MTFSIVAIDKKTNETGFAIASCAWDAGQVTQAKPLTGAIASQARGNMAFKQQFFQKLSEGKTVEEILQFFKESDPDIQYRQIGMITQDGQVLSHTGEKCSYWAGHKTGPDYACQGNILVGPQVIENMTHAFTSTKGELIDRLFAALKSGDEAGGDARGKQSARIHTVKSGGFKGQDFVIDIRVEDHPEPVQEVGRILNAGKDMFTSFLLTKELDNEKLDNKLESLEKLETFLGKHQDRRFIDGFLTLAWSQLELGMKDKALKTYRKILDISPSMKEYFRHRINKKELPEEILA